MHNSPFKFLDAYQKQDKEMFFGRSEETDILYQMTFNTQMLLIYGASGTGKSSLVQAGLANKFSPTRWKEVFVRRKEVGQHNINDSLAQVLNRELEAVRAKTAEEFFEPIEAMHRLFQRTHKPIYLIFDQFEELFIQNQDQQEQEDFFLFIEELLTENLPCKILLIMREEFLASLWPFEQRIPSLFSHRFRVEPMREGQVLEVIQKTLERFERQRIIAIEPGKLTEIAQQILQNLAGQKNYAVIELTYLQVYLDRLYQMAQQEAGSDLPTFTLDLVARTGNIDDVIGDFLDDQLIWLEQSGQGIRPGTPIRILGRLVTEEQTKRILELDQLKDSLKAYRVTDKELHACLQAFVNMRILKPYQEMSGKT